MTGQVEVAWDLGALLGEGPVWSTRDRALWFVDIKNRRLHCFDPADGRKRSFETPDQPGFALPAAGGGLVVGMPGGVHHFDPASGRFRQLFALEADRPGNRINDGHVDTEGRLWFGTMDDAETAPSGAVYSWDARRGAGEAGLRRHVDGIPITNGPALSPDGRIFYHTDTAGRTVSAFDLAEDGSLGDARVLIRIEDGAGWPDGTAVDVEGCLWIGLYGGWAARRYSPTGALLETVAFPCANVTKLSFGGPDRLDLYATTAAKGLSAEARAAQPLAGALFHLRARVPGLVPAEVFMPPEG